MTRPDTPYSKLFVDISPFNAYYFTNKKQIITYYNDNNYVNCSIAIVDLNISEVTEYKFSKCPDLWTVYNEAYDKILAYNNSTISAYILHYPYVLIKATQSTVDYII